MVIHLPRPSCYSFAQLGLAIFATPPRDFWPAPPATLSSCCRDKVFCWFDAEEGNFNCTLATQSPTLFRYHSALSRKIASVVIFNQHLTKFALFSPGLPTQRRRCWGQTRQLRVYIRLALAEHFSVFARVTLQTNSCQFHRILQS